MNVDINKEVQRAMMSPSQDQGIVNLLASELKARDAKARQQINNLMAGQPDPNSIMAQNEREVENSVRQEIGQKMQARVMQERQAQARQRQALAGIAGQRAPNMRMADGGIVGYAEGGPAQEEAGMLDKIKAGLGGLFGGGEKEQAAPFDVEGRVIELIKARETANEEAKARIDQELSGFDPATVMSARQRMSQGMQAGGIVGLQEGGMPRFPRLFDFSMFLAEKGIDSLAGLSADAVNRLTQEYEAMQAREMNRPRGDSVSESQMENLGGVLRGAGNVLTEGIAGLAPEPQGRNRTELADMGGAPGAGGAPQARREPRGKGILSQMFTGSPRALENRENFNQRLAEAQDARETQARDMARRSFEETQAAFAGTPTSDDEAGLTPREAARRRFERVQAAYEGVPTTDESPLTAEEVASINENIARGDSFGQELIRRIKADPANAISTAMMLIPVGGWAGALGTKAVTKLIPYMVKHPMLASFVAGSTMKLPAPDVEKALTSIGLGEDLEEVKDTILTELLAPDPLDELRAPEQTDEETLQQIVDAGVTAEQYREATGPAAPTTPAIDRGAIDAASALAREVETAPSGAEGAARAASVITGRDGEAAVTQLASTVAQNPTPENTSRFESEIQRLMERRESPMRALSSFLTSFSQARGGSMGQNLAIATTAMRAADDALDKQIVELEKLRRADQISERDFNLKQNQFDAQKDLIAAQASYYNNYQSMQENIQRIRAEQGDTAARASLLGDITTAISSEMFRYMTAASKLLNTKDLNAPEVMEKAKELMREAINDSYTTALQQIGLAGAGSSSLGTDIRSELEAYVGQQ